MPAAEPVTALPWAVAAAAAAWVLAAGRRPPPARWSQVATGARPRARRPARRVAEGGASLVRGLAPGRAGRRAAAAEAVVSGLLGSMAAALRSGQQPAAALAGCLPEGAPDPLGRRLSEAASAGLAGGPVADLLRAAAREPGAGALAWLAAVWAAAEDSGAPMAAAVTRLAQSARAAQARRGEAAAELAGPVASARLLAALPLLGLVLGAGLGAEPLGFLLGPGWGRLVLVTGAALDLAGLWWVGRLVRAAQR